MSLIFIYLLLMWQSAGTHHRGRAVSHFLMYDDWLVSTFTLAECQKHFVKKCQERMWLDLLVEETKKWRGSRRLNCATACFRLSAKKDYHLSRTNITIASRKHYYEVAETLLSRPGNVTITSQKHYYTRQETLLPEFADIELRGIRNLNCKKLKNKRDSITT